VLVVSQRELLHLHVNQAIILNNPELVQTVPPVIVQEEEVQEEAIVVVPGAEVVAEDAKSR